MIFKVDYEKHIVFITFEHLNKRPRWMVEHGILNFYSLSFDNVHSDYRSAYYPFKKRGYSLVITRDGKKLLLCFNKPEVSDRLATVDVPQRRIG